eukprot:COSAG02_NODE_8107_length_2707_cov_17.269555_2_plen_154_part_00
MEGGDDAHDVVFDRATALAELTAVETNLHMLLKVYAQRLDRQNGTMAVRELVQTEHQQETAAAAAAAALPELQHHVGAFLASAKALDDHFAALEGAVADESATSVSKEIGELKAELAAKDALLAKQGDNLVKWQMLFAKLSADATAMADDPEA